MCSCITSICSSHFEAEVVVPILLQLQTFYTFYSNLLSSQHECLPSYLGSQEVPIVKKKEGSFIQIGQG